MVVDTNVIAYYLLGSRHFIDECREFWKRVKEPLAPASWQPELLNVLWLAVRKKAITETDALLKLKYTEKLSIETRSVENLWEGALIRSLKSGLSAYDTIFIELALRENIPMVSFDKAVLLTFPDVAKRPRDLVR